MKVFDIESIPALFLIVFKDLETKVLDIFEISEYKDQRKELYNYLVKLNREGITLIGYNNIGFDYPILHFYLRNVRKWKGSITEILFKEVSRVIGEKSKWKIKIKKPLIKQIDLMSINTFDNSARSTSLDKLKFVFRRDTISTLDLSLLTATSISKEKIEELTQYCIDDVDTTEELWYKSTKPLSVRNALPKHLKDFYNYNDVQLGENSLLREYCMKTGAEEMEVKRRRTTYKSIHLKDVIYPYLITYFKEFNIPVFNTFITWLLDQEVDPKNLDGAFTKLTKEKLGILTLYVKEDINKEGEYKKLTLLYKGYEFTYGMGGLHSINTPGTHEEDGEHFLITSDVALN